MAFLPAAKENEYYALIRKIESGGDDNAKNSRSTASGRYQPIKSTWLAYGLNWKDVFNPIYQEKFIRLFTADNARQLLNSGCAINFATLYGAHFLGANGLLSVMRGKPSDSITTVTSAAQRKANPTILSDLIDNSANVKGSLRKRTIKDFCDWLEKKTGDSVYKRYTVAGGVSVAAPEIKPTENISMNWLNGLVTKTTIQYVLVAIGGFLTGSGIIDAASWQEISAGLLLLIPALFGIKNAATEKAMVNGKVVKLAEFTPATQASIAKEAGAK